MSFNQDIIKLRGTVAAYKPNSGGNVDMPYPVRAIVKDNIDVTKSGRIRVYIAEFGGLNPDDSSSWTPVSYLSPFFGVTAGNVASKTSLGTYTQNPHSYGFWNQPPDIGTEVICVFLSGKKDFGYYIGSIPTPGLMHMLPAIGTSDNVIPNATEGAGYGGATKLPVTEINSNNPKSQSSPDQNEYRPIHSTVAGQFFQQGLIRDNVRGPISSSAMRESPSRVFGISTPGRPLYSGGFTGTDPEIASKVKSAKDSDLKVVGRRGGHTIVMDDGDFQGENNLLRLRTSAGHQITMSDDGQTLFVIHANGQSFIELGKEGTVDIFSMNSFNVRSQGDINFHADNNININAKKQLNIFAEQLNLNTDKDMNVRVGTEFKQHTVGDHTVKVDKKMSFNSKGDSSLASDALTYVNGAKINLNTGSTSLKPKEIKPIPTIAHTDTLFDKTNGWIPAPALLTSITSRAPAHTPWVNSNMGVDVKVNASASAILPSSPSPSVAAVNNSVPSSPQVPTTPSKTATVPTTQAISKNIDKSTSSALISQAGCDVSADAKLSAAANGTGVLDLNGTKSAVLGALGHTPAQLEEAGHLKPGSAALVEKSVASGMSIDKAMPSILFTGKDNINNPSDFLRSPQAQVNCQAGLMSNQVNALQSSGVITGQESGAQIGGLVMAATKFGADSLKSLLDAGKSTPSLAGIQGGATALVPNLTNNPVAQSISSGNFAAGLSDKSINPAGKIMGSLQQGAASLADSVKGAAAGAFNAIKSTFKALKGGQPQNLNIVAAGDVAKSAANNITSGLPGIQGGTGSLADLTKSAGVSINAAGSILPTNSSGLQSATPITGAGLVTSGLKAFSGGVSAVGNYISKAVSSSPISANNIVTNATKLKLSDVSSGTNFNSSLSGLSQKIGAGLNLNSLANTGLDASGKAALTSAISALNSGGPNSIKMPTIATDTVNRDEINAQAKALLGPGVPLPITASSPPNFKPVSADLQKSYDELKTQLATKEDLKWVLRKEWLDAKYYNGPDSTQAAFADEQYKLCLQSITDIKKQMSEVTKQMFT
jgi:hypothetical protein